MIEPAARMVVGIVVERQAVDHAWVDHRWTSVAVLPGNPVAAPWTVIGQGEGFTRYLAGTAWLDLFRLETETYKYNLESAVPAVYVILRKVDEAPGVTLLAATVCPGEAHAHADTGEDLVEALPMPQPINEWLSAFVTEHHVERVQYKRKRDRADPEALGQRGLRAQGAGATRPWENADE